VPRRVASHFWQLAQHLPGKTPDGNKVRYFPATDHNPQLALGTAEASV